jgi:hypothetical protein
MHPFHLLIQDHFLTDVILREVVDRMSKDFADDTGAYLDFPETNRYSTIDLQMI